MDTYPGKPQHQALLARIVAHYQADERIRAVCVFGSLGRGNWDEYSDLDMDIVIADDVRVDVMAELAQLCQSFQPDSALIIVPDGRDAGNIVLASLMEISVRYHPLASTSPNIVDSLKVLTGTLALDAIQAAGQVNRLPASVASSHEVDKFLRWSHEVVIAVRRGKFWQAERLLQLMRSALIEIFAFSRGHVRSYPAFDAYADEALRTKIGALLPDYGLRSATDTLMLMLDFLEHELPALSDGRLQLTEPQRVMLAKIRHNLTTQDESS